MTHYQQKSMTLLHGAIPCFLHLPHPFRPIRRAHQHSKSLTSQQLLNSVTLCDGVG